MAAYTFKWRGAPRGACMYRVSTHPIVIRFMVWAVSIFLLVAFYLVSAGGFRQLMEYVNDIFLIGPPGL